MPIVSIVGGSAAAHISIVADEKVDGGRRRLSAAGSLKEEQGQVELEERERER